MNDCENYCEIENYIDSIKSIDRQLIEIYKNIEKINDILNGDLILEHIKNIGCHLDSLLEQLDDKLSLNNTINYIHEGIKMMIREELIKFKREIRDEENKITN